MLSGYLDVHCSLRSNNPRRWGYVKLFWRWHDGATNVTNIAVNQAVTAMWIITGNAVSWDTQVECHGNERSVNQSTVTSVNKTCQYTMQNNTSQTVKYGKDCFNKESQPQQSCFLEIISTGNCSIIALRSTYYLSILWHKSLINVCSLIRLFLPATVPSHTPNAKMAAGLIFFCLN